MRNGISPIIIDNTNLHAWEMKPYAVMVSDKVTLYAESDVGNSAEPIKQSP
ncbi:hypothetical protein MC885_006364 [Smutsia gigantea]|nr:hypothetical protein MC885_006364 [Smutsia gigantea]